MESCLKQFTNYTDDFVVFDTESSDNSFNIAKKFTNKVYLVPHIAQPDPYFEPAMLRAKNEWYLIAVSDEVWDEECLKHLEDYNKKTIDVVQFHRLENGQNDGSLHMRLMRKGKVLITDLLDWWIPEDETKMTVSKYLIEHNRTEEQIRYSAQFRKDSSVYIKQKYRFTNMEPYKSRIAQMPY